MQSHELRTVSLNRFVAAEKEMCRIFLGACALSVSLIVLLVVLIPEWRELPRYVRVGVPALLLWSFVVNGYAFSRLHSFNQQVKEELNRKAFIDEITAVFNFRYLDQRLREECARTSRYGGTVALLFLDLDRFKEVNDRFGHQTGNIVLRDLATAMDRQVRVSDVLGRAGGDEFITLLPETNRDQAKAIAERLRAAVQNHVTKVSEDRQVDFVRVSVGVAVYPENGDSPEHLISAADKAAYAAKRLGGNRVQLAEGLVSDGPQGGEFTHAVSTRLAGEEEMDTQPG